MTSKRPDPVSSAAARGRARGGRRLHLSRGRSAAAEARDFVRATLESWYVEGSACDDALLVISELVSNAVQHGQGDPVLEVRMERESVVLRVSDDDPTPPRLQDHDLFAVRGRGLQIVNAVATQWGHERDAVGKWVWVEFQTASRAPAGGGSLV